MLKRSLPLRIAGLSLLIGVSTGSKCALAQTSLSIYGIISEGLVVTSNQGGHSKVALDSGTMQPSRLGFRGVEDLGQGNSALFVLENGYSVDTGALGQGGRIFGRQAYVGLGSRTLGMITLGRQYEEMAQQLWWSESGTIFGALGTRIGDNDNAFGTFRLNNSIRYQSPTIGGFSFAAQYALSEVAGSSNNNSAYSVGATYLKDDLKIAAVVTQLNNPASASNPTNGAVDNAGYGFSSPFVTSPLSTKVAVEKQKIYGLGAAYKIGTYQFGAGYSNVRYDYLDATGLKLQNFEVYGTKSVTPNLLFGLGLIRTNGEYSTNAEPHYTQVNIGLDYFLSKRTDLYIVDSYQKAGGSATYAQLFAAQPSSTTSQNTVIAGIRHKF